MFLMATHLFFFIHDILYAHILYVLHKKLLRVAQKTMLWQKKKFHIEVTLRTKIMGVTKKYVVAIKKIMWHPKERLMLTKYVQCCKEKEYMLAKNSSCCCRP